MNIAMLGTGYVGLVAGVCFADAGHQVAAVDSNREKIDSLNNGTLPFFEPGLNDLFQRNRKRMDFYYDIAKAVNKSDVVFVAVGTPELEDGSADLEPTFGVLKEVCQAADSSKYIVLKSTVPIGTAQKVKSFCKEYATYPMEVINNPEFLRQGAAVDDFISPDRIVIGCESEKAQSIMHELYKPYIENGNPIYFMDNTSAEMTKYAANSFLAMKISFINELALLADKLGADVESVRKGFTSDNRINPKFLHPGIGYGGSCFPKDVRALEHTAQEQGLDLLLWQATDQANERQKSILAHRLHERVGSLNGLNVALWGLAFKPHTDDVRRAPSIQLIKELVAHGAHVTAYDPVATANAKAACPVDFTTSESAIEAADNADALIIVTEWAEFKAANLNTLKDKMKTPLIFDGRNLFPPQDMREAGIEYYGVGRPLKTKE